MLKNKACLGVLLRGWGSERAEDSVLRAASRDEDDGTSAPGDVIGADVEPCPRAPSCGRQGRRRLLVVAAFCGPDRQKLL